MQRTDVTGMRLIGRLRERRNSAQQAVVCRKGKEAAFFVFRLGKLRRRLTAAIVDCQNPLAVRLKNAAEPPKIRGAVCRRLLIVS